MRELRVGVITENHFPHVGGMEVANHLLSRALDRLPETRVAVAFTNSPANGNGRAYRYPYRSYRAPSCSILTPYLRRRNVERMVARERIDVLYGPMLHGGGRRALAVGRRRGLPVVASAQGVDLQVVPEIGYGARLDAGTAARVQEVLKNADRVVVLSRHQERLAVELGADPARLALIPNGVAHGEIGAVPPAEPRADPRARYGFRENDFLLLTVGRNSPVKRLELLYRALVLARRRAPALRCLSVGPRASLAETVRRCGADNAVILAGAVAGPGEPPFPELVRLQRAADLYVSVSWAESFGNAALESLACGTPVLVGRRHGVRDVVSENETGFVLEEETPEVLARLLVELCSERDALRARRAEIRASVAHLSWERIAARVRRLAGSLRGEAP